MCEDYADAKAELEQSGVEAVMLLLLLALPWSQENLERDKRTWPAPMMVERFAEIVQAMAAEKSAAAVP